MSLPSVDQFKNSLLLGGARANYFLVTGNNMGGDFPFLCRAASLPAANVNAVEVKTPGGRSIKLAGERTFEAWGITVYNDTQMVMRRRFEAWQAACANYGNPIGADALDAYGRSDWVVTQLSRSGVPVRSYNFYNMWPQSLGAIDLTFDDAGNIEEFEVTMEYSHYEPVGEIGSLDGNIAAIINAVSGALGVGGIASAVSNLGNIIGAAAAIAPGVPFVGPPAP
jgi:hypothetical protein